MDEIEVELKICLRILWSVLCEEGDRVVICRNRVDCDVWLDELCYEVYYVLHDSHALTC